MELKLSLKFVPFNVNINEGNTLIADNNDVDNWEELIYKLTPGKWSIKKVNRKNIVLEKDDFI